MISPLSQVCARDGAAGGPQQSAAIIAPLVRWGAGAVVVMVPGALVVVWLALQAVAEVARKAQTRAEQEVALASQVT